MLERLNQAMQDMRNAASSQQAGTPQGEAQARRAAERSEGSRADAAGMRSKESTNQVDDLARQAEDLARRTAGLRRPDAQRLRPESPGLTREQADQLAGEKDGEAPGSEEPGAGHAERRARPAEHPAARPPPRCARLSAKCSRPEIQRDMQRNADWIRRGMGGYAVMSEATITQGLNELRDQLKQVQQAMSKDGKGAGGKDDTSSPNRLSARSNSSASRWSR